MTSPGGRARAATAEAVLLDCGPLVALHARDDPAHKAVARWMTPFRGTLHTVEPVLAEAAFFLPARSREALAGLAARGDLHVHPVDPAGNARLAQLFRTYADQDPDWADLALVWLAEVAGISRIATLDVAHFSAYRINGRKRFELELLR